jgi:hypothetical protein
MTIRMYPNPGVRAKEKLKKLTCVMYDGMKVRHDYNYGNTYEAPEKGYQTDR